MNINKISFGRVIKVNAPFPIAMQIADLANSSENKKLNKEAKKIFYDITPDGKARVHASFDDQNTSYIFSGKDSEVFSRSTLKAKNCADSLYRKYGGCGCQMSDIESEIAWSSHNERVKCYILKNLEAGSLNVVTNRNGDKITSIDFVL